MALKHHKKRNVGLLNEFFARYMAKAIIEHRDLDLQRAKELFGKHFQKNTDLHRELKLFTCLFETKLTNKESAISLLEQVKKACKLQSQARLELEKTALLHEINLVIKGSKFFDQEIQDFREYGAVQVLLNHWRGSLLTEDLSEVAQLEDRLIERLLVSSKDKPGSSSSSKSLGMTNEDVDGLVVGIMTEKLNSKFSSILSEDQKKILQLYVFSKDNLESKQSLSSMLENIRSQTLEKIEYSLQTDSEVKKVDKKLQEILGMLKEGDYKNTSNPTDQMITFYMTVSKLKEEL